MTHFTEQVGFPNIPLGPGMKLRLRALDPTADTTVAGVTSSQWMIYGRDESESPTSTEDTGQVLLIHAE